MHFKVKHARKKICVLVCKKKCNMEVTWNNDLSLLLFNYKLLINCIYLLHVVKLKNIS